MAAGMVRSRLNLYNRIRRGEGGGVFRWVAQGHQERPKGYRFNRTPLQRGMSIKISYVPQYIAFLTMNICCFALDAKPDLTIDKKAFERPEKQNLAPAYDYSE